MTAAPEDGRPTLVAATGNLHKLEELRRLVGPPFRVVGLHELLPPAATWREPPSSVVESGSTFEENAIIKALHASRHQPALVIADDSGLCVDALHGRPGVHSARHGGPGLSDRERYELVLRELRDVPDGRRTARYRAAVVLARAGRILATAEGTCEGVLLRGGRGSGGFGYDPIFLVPSLALTMAELTAEQKDAISHRGAAFRALAGELRALAGDA